MPSKKGIEQALNWLNDKARDKNSTLDSINAELCINVIMDLQRQYDRLGAMFNNLRNNNNSADVRMKKLSFLE